MILGKKLLLDESSLNINNQLLLGLRHGFIGYVLIRVLITCSILTNTSI